MVTKEQYFVYLDSEADEAKVCAESYLYMVEKNGFEIIKGFDSCREAWYEAGNINHKRRIEKIDAEIETIRKSKLWR